jgi:hypothetical protein
MLYYHFIEWNHVWMLTNVYGGSQSRLAHSVFAANTVRRSYQNECSVPDGTYQHCINNQRLTDHIRNSGKALDFLGTLASIPTRNEEMEDRNFHKIPRPLRKSTFNGVCRWLLTVKQEEWRKWLSSQRKFWNTTSLKCIAEWLWTVVMVNWLGRKRTMTFERWNADYIFWMTHIIWSKSHQINGAGMRFVVIPAWEMKQ